jgi:hypothetical protein
MREGDRFEVKVSTPVEQAGVRVYALGEWRAWGASSIRANDVIRSSLVSERGFASVGCSPLDNVTELQARGAIILAGEKRMQLIASVRGESANPTLQRKAHAFFCALMRGTSILQIREPRPSNTKPGGTFRSGPSGAGGARPSVKTPLGKPIGGDSGAVRGAFSESPCRLSPPRAVLRQRLARFTAVDCELE